MVTDPKRYSIRPQTRNSKNDSLDGAFRILVSGGEMQRLGLSQGNFIVVESDSTGSRAFGIASRDHHTGGNPSTSVLRVSDFWRSHYKFELNDKYTVTKFTDNLYLIKSISVKTADDKLSSFDLEDIKWWIDHSLAKLDVIVRGGTFEIIPHPGNVPGQKILFTVEAIEYDLYNQSHSNWIPYYTDRNSKIVVSNELTLDLPQIATTTTVSNHDGYINLIPDLTFKDIVGHENVLKKLKQCIRHRMKSPGIILGPSKVGKSLILHKLTLLKWSMVKEINHNTKRKDLVAIFEDALKIENQPALLIIDNLDITASKSEGFEFANSLAKQIMRLDHHGDDCQVTVIAAANRSVDIHPEINCVFDITFQLELPSSIDRYHSLKQLTDHHGYDISDDIIHDLVKKTHGFNYPDLRKLVNEAWAISILDKEPSLPKTRISLSSSDFSDALKNVHASAMNEVFVTTPSVTWNDIAGSESIKQELDLVIKMVNSSAINSFIKPVRGVLMYGPPGCSKTLIARALASQSHFNFLSVKGPELVSKYVGDTELNIREIFRRAKAAAPSVLFFDEFDAVSKRDTGHGSFNPVTALLAEMDGYEVLDGVLVIAATNAPWEIDHALLRPGRFDQLCYVGLPSTEARKQILSMNLSGIRLNEEVNLEYWATEQTDGWSGAQVAGLCESAKRNALQRLYIQIEAVENQPEVTQKDFLKAFQQSSKGIPSELVDKLTHWRDKVQGTLYGGAS